jgi:dTDP-4-dehydrorhamnose 3,5-epimerase
MKVTQTPLPGVLVIEPFVSFDSQGLFLENWSERSFTEATGIEATFVQDNHSRSERNVLRGIHYQLVHPQGKLVRVVSGEVFNVAVDLRRTSPRFGHWYGCRLSAAAFRQLWIPPGFGHGFLVLSETADFLYKATDYWSPTLKRSIAWNDPQLAIAWPLFGTPPTLAPRDADAPALASAQVYDSAPSWRADPISVEHGDRELAILEDLN